MVTHQKGSSSKTLCNNDNVETVPENEKTKVQPQLQGKKTLKKLKRVSRLFSEAARYVLMDFREMFWAWIATKDCTVEGVHVGMIVFQACTRTNELLCNKMQYVGVSGSWSIAGWYADYETQFEQTRALAYGDPFEQAHANANRSYGTQ